MSALLNRALFLVAAFVCVSWVSPSGIAAGEPGPDIKVQMVGEEIRAEVSMFVRAPRQLVWDVITDYERAPEYTRDLQVSRIVSRTGDTLRLLQKSVVRYGLFTIPLETVRDIRLAAPLRIESRLVSGSMKKYETTTELVPEAGGTRILVRSQAIPGSALAAFAGESIVRRETEERFRELRAEIMRREHVAIRQ